MDATQKYQEPVTKSRLLGWHSALFPSGRSGIHKISVGAWRKDTEGPMRVISGPMGKEKIHFVAPAASLVNAEMTDFLQWVNISPKIDLVVQAALAHLWFVTIHPFDDGNGSIARAIADMLLARTEGSNERFYSMSAQIQTERRDYYEILEHVQKGTLDVSEWIKWFLGCLGRAFKRTDTMLANVIAKARFWERISGQNLNDRQKKILNLAIEGQIEKLTSSKWAKMVSCSQDTAHRDIVDLIDRKILVKDDGGGRSTSYSIHKSHKI